MAKRKPKSEQSPNAAQSSRRRQAAAGGVLPGGPDTSSLLRVLVIHGSEALAAELSASIAATGTAACESCPDVATAARLLENARFDVALLDLDLPNNQATEFSRALNAKPGSPRVVFTSRDRSFEASVTAMRSGAADLLVVPIAPGTLAQSVRAAGEQCRKLRAQERRVERLKRICRRLTTARSEVTQQVDVLCTDLVTAYQELAEQMEQVTMAGEFGSLIRQELDVESLLRTTLEYMLTKTGPTNAAVFLPTGPREYSLGAYVNYDIPRETADVLLDHLADSLPQRFENEEELLHSETSAELAEWASQGAGWIAGSTVVVFACRARGECLGVAALFRDPSRPFTPEIMAQVRLMRDLFTQQLARVIHVHNRHKPADAWPGFGEDDERDDYGMAA